MTHPSSLVLESFAVGEPLPAAHAAHVEACAECAAFVGELHGVIATSPSAEEADAAVARALATAGGELAAAKTKDAPLEPAARSNRAPGAAARRAKQRRAWTLATSVIAPLAAAAAIFLLARSQPGPSPTDPLESRIAVPAASPDRLLMGTLPPRQEPDTRFKGGMQIAVVRDRGGRQERFPGTVRVRPGDRLRVEVALDQEQAILAAVLGDDGSYVELMPQGTRGPGTHFSERSAKVDATPTRGTIVIGSPEAVALARATKQLTGLTTLRVEWEAP